MYAMYEELARAQQRLDRAQAGRRGRPVRRARRRARRAKRSEPTATLHLARARSV
jgi:hypothetical protein